MKHRISTALPAKACALIVALRQIPSARPAAPPFLPVNTHKLIYYWKKDQWECFDLIKDPEELRNIYHDPASRATVAQLKEELFRLKKYLKHEDQFSDVLPPDGVDVPAPPPAAEARSVN